jgi:hypothetical protein
MQVAILLLDRTVVLRRMTEMEEQEFVFDVGGAFTVDHAFELAL